MGRRWLTWNSKRRHFHPRRELHSTLIPRSRFPIQILGCLTLRYALRVQPRRFLGGCRPAGPVGRLPRGGGLGQSCAPAIPNRQKHQPRAVEQRLAVRRAQRPLCLQAHFSALLPAVEGRGRLPRSERCSYRRGGASRNLRCPEAERGAQVEDQQQDWERWIGRRTGARRPHPARRVDYDVAVRGLDLAEELRRNSATSEQGG